MIFHIKEDVVPFPLRASPFQNKKDWKYFPVLNLQSTFNLLTLEVYSLGSG